MNHLDSRNRKLTVWIFLLCFCYAICTMPHVIYGYTEHTYSEHGQSSRIMYGVTLGIFWLQYGINIVVYVGQRDQYWKALRDYVNEVMLPLFMSKDYPNESIPRSQYTLNMINDSYSCVKKPSTSLTK